MTVDAIKGEAIGPASPTTATRMDKFFETLLSQTGLVGMIGKAERGREAIAFIKNINQSIYQYLVALYMCCQRRLRIQR